MTMNTPFFPFQMLRDTFFPPLSMKTLNELTVCLPVSLISPSLWVCGKTVACQVIFGQMLQYKEPSGAFI